METAETKTLVGLMAFARDDTKLGKIKGYLGDDTTGEFLVVGRFLARDLVIPFGVVEIRDDRVVVPRSSSFIDCAPTVNAKGAISAEDATRLEEFYRVSSG